jgi:hypothetical protein
MSESEKTYTVSSESGGAVKLTVDTSAAEFPVPVTDLAETDTVLVGYGKQLRQVTVPTFHSRNKITVATPASRGREKADLRQSGSSSVSDDLDEATAALSDTYGGTIELWEGPLSITRPWAITKHRVTVIGAGRPNDKGTSGGTRIEADASFSDDADVKALVVVNSADASCSLGGMHLRHLAIDGNGVGQGVHGLLFCAFESSLDHLGIFETTGDGIHMYANGPTDWERCYQDNFGDVRIKYCGGVGWKLTGIDHQGRGPTMISNCGSHGLEVNGSGIQLSVGHCYTCEGAAVQVVSGASRNSLTNWRAETCNGGLDIDAQDAAVTSFQWHGGNISSNSRMGKGALPEVVVTGDDFQALTVELHGVYIIPRNDAPDMAPSSLVALLPQAREFNMIGGKLGNHATIAQTSIHPQATARFTSVINYPDFSQT